MYPGYKLFDSSPRGIYPLYSRRLRIWDSLFYFLGPLAPKMSSEKLILNVFQSEIKKVFWLYVKPGNRSEPKWKLRSLDRESRCIMYHKIILVLSWVEDRRVLYMNEKDLLDKVLFWYKRLYPAEYLKRKYVTM